MTSSTSTWATKGFNAVQMAIAESYINGLSENLSGQDARTPIINIKFITNYLGAALLEIRYNWEE